MLTWLALLQASAGPPIPLDLHVVRPCLLQQDSDDVVVCARRDPLPRLEKLPTPVKSSPEEAMSFRLPGGGRGRVHAIQSNVGGFTGKGAVVTLTMPFGKRKKSE